MTGATEPRSAVRAGSPLPLLSCTPDPGLLEWGRCWPSSASTLVRAPSLTGVWSGDPRLGEPRARGCVGWKHGGVSGGRGWCAPETALPDIRAPPAGLGGAAGPLLLLLLRQGGSHSHYSSDTEAQGAGPLPGASAAHGGVSRGALVPGDPLQLGCCCLSHHPSSQSPAPVTGTARTPGSLRVRPSSVPRGQLPYCWSAGGSGSRDS